MDADLRAVWERYVASWRAESAAEKQLLFDGCLAAECVYTDPLTRAEGWQALTAYMLEFHEQVPGGHFVTEQFLAHHGKSLAKWQMLNGDAVKIGEGVSYAEYDEQNRLRVMTGFFETPTDSR
jgi:hypothetical protein